MQDQLRERAANRGASNRTIESPASFQRIKTERAFEGIASQIRSLLANGRLRPGDRLPSERDLAEQFGVSRNTVREALRSLENAGLLRLQKGHTGGAFIAESAGSAVVSGLRDMFHLGAIKLEHLTQARIWIGSVAVRAACELATPDDIAAMKANIMDAERAQRKGDFYLRAATHLEFHRLIARATKNPVMMIVMDAILEVMKHFIDTIGPHDKQDVLPSRRRFVRHFEARDCEAAVAEMEQHLRRVHRTYLSLLAKERS
jgi:GntR family transcriptional repressor for pyruvate dehydrogenase complex